MTIHEQEAEEALGKWSSSKYAGLDDGIHESVAGESRPWKSAHIGWLRNTQGVAYAEDGTVFVTIQHYIGDPYLYKVIPDESQTLIKDDLPTAGGKLDYNHHRGTLLWAREGEVMEIDKDGNVVNSLTTPNGTGFAGHWSGPDTFMLYHPNNHYVNELNWDGDELWSFGVYGTGGSDLSHLDHPHDVAPRTEGGGVVCDTRNSRILYVAEDGTVKRVNVLTRPTNVEFSYPSTSMAVSTDPSISGMPANAYPFWNLLIGGYEGVWWGQRQCAGNDLAVHPTNPLLLTATGQGTFLSNLRLFHRKPVIPSEWKPVHDQSIDAGATYSTPPLFVGPYDKMAVYSYGDQTHDVHIEKLRSVGWLKIENGTTQSYYDFDVPSMSADTLERYMTDYPFQIVRLTVENTGGASGTFDLWLNLE